MDERYEPVPDDALPEQRLAALEAVLMVVDEPVPAAALAEVLQMPTGQVTDLLHQLAADYRGAGGSTPHGSTATSSGSSWWRARRRGSPRPRSRPSRWWPTASP